MSNRISIIEIVESWLQEVGDDCIGARGTPYKKLSYSKAISLIPELFDVLEASGFNKRDDYIGSMAKAIAVALTIKDSLAKQYGNKGRLEGLEKVIKDEINKRWKAHTNPTEDEKIELKAQAEEREKIAQNEELNALLKEAEEYQANKAKNPIEMNGNLPSMPTLDVEYDEDFLKMMGASEDERRRK